MRQKWRLAEVKAEEYAFVLLSRLINAVEEQVSFHLHTVAWPETATSWNVIQSAGSHVCVCLSQTEVKLLLLVDSMLSNAADIQAITFSAESTTE